MFFMHARNIGYVGGSVLHRLLVHPSASTFDITALVRDETKAKKLEEKFGVHSVVGSLKDTALVEKLAENAHVVFSLVRPSSCKFYVSYSNLAHRIRPTQTTFLPYRQS